MNRKWKVLGRGKGGQGGKGAKSRANYENKQKQSDLCTSLRFCVGGTRANNTTIGNPLTEVLDSTP